MHFTTVCVNSSDLAEISRKDLKVGNIRKRNENNFGKNYKYKKNFTPHIIALKAQS